MSEFIDKQKQMEEYVRENNPYRELEPLYFDLRGYTKYIEDNHIDKNNIPDEVVQRFIKH